MGEERSGAVLSVLSLFHLVLACLPHLLAASDSPSVRAGRGEER